MGAFCALNSPSTPGVDWLDRILQPTQPWRKQINGASNDEDRQKVFSNQPGGRLSKHTAAAGVMALALAMPAFAGPREQAKRIHDRLTGVPPTAAVLDDMVTAMGTSAESAALLAIDPTRSTSTTSP